MLTSGQLYLRGEEGLRLLRHRLHALARLRHGEVLRQHVGHLLEGGLQRHALLLGSTQFEGVERTLEGVLGRGTLLDDEGASFLDVAEEVLLAGHSVGGLHGRAVEGGRVRGEERDRRREGRRQLGLEDGVGRFRLDECAWRILRWRVVSLRLCP